MSGGEDLKARLASSDSIASMRAEQEVAGAFEQGPWWTVEHGSFFRDLTTGKLRELDVRAKRHWSTTRKVDVQLELLIEVKSIAGYHLVFASHPDGPQGGGAQTAWLGYMRERLHAALIEAGANKREIRQIADRFRALSYPDGIAVIDALTIDPPKPEVLATAFRETNIGSEKELETSVLWKAIQGLTSAIESSRSSKEAGLASDLRLSIEVAREDNRNVTSAVESVISGRARSLTIYHPVVVVDARMWALERDDLVEVDYARFVIHEQGAWPRRWIDVVTRRSFGTWAQSVTAHYGAKLENPDEYLLREGLDSLHMFTAFLLDPDLDIEVKVKNPDTNERFVLTKRASEVAYTVRTPGKKHRPVATPIPSHDRSE